MRQCIIFILYLLCTFTARSQSVLTPEQTGSIYYAYPAPPSVHTPAPAGYEPFYISHYGRHGSRWMTADERYTEVICVFDSLYQCSGLTPLGMDVRQRLHKVWEDARCQKYKRPEHEDHWIWNFDFYNGPVEDLRYIAGLIGA